MFCEGYAETGQAKDAYKKAYGKYNDRAAYRLLDQWYIQDFLECLTDCHGDTIIMPRAECLVVLADIARGIGEAVNPSDQIRAVATMSKMRGFDAPSRHEHSGPGGKPMEIRAKGLTKEDIQNIRAATLGIPQTANI